MDPGMVAALVAAVTAVAYPQAFPKAPLWQHRVVFIGGLCVAAALVFLEALPRSRLAHDGLAAPTAIRALPTAPNGPIQLGPAVAPPSGIKGRTTHKLPAHLTRFFSLTVRGGGFGDVTKRDSLEALYISGENDGSEEVSWRLDKVALSYPAGRCVIPGANGDDTFPGKTTEIDLQVHGCEIFTPTPNQGVQANLRITLVYDTVPETGERRSTVLLRCTVGNPSAPDNSLLPKMLANCQVLSDRPE